MKNIEIKENFNQKVFSHLCALTTDDVRVVLNIGINQVTMLREVGILKGIKTGKSYIYSQSEIMQVLNDYQGLDISSKLKAMQSREIVENRKAAY